MITLYDRNDELIVDLDVFALVLFAVFSDFLCGFLSGFGGTAGLGSVLFFRCGHQHDAGTDAASGSEDQQDDWQEF